MRFFSLFFVILALGASVKLEESSVETGSGSGDVQITSGPTVYLLDDNGDISTSPNNLTDRSQNSSLPDLDYVLDNFTTEASGGNESTTMINITTETSVETTPTMPYFHSAVSKKTTTIETTTTTENAVDATIMTTEDYSASTTPEVIVTSKTSTTKTPTTTPDVTSTSIPKQKTTTSTKRTTSASSTTTASTKSNKSKSQMPSRKPSEDKNVCVFLNPDFECNKEVVCFGEGEIDCEPEEDQLILDKISVSSPSEDNIDYEESILESDTIGTFPPNLVGTQKKVSMYNLPTVTPTSAEMEETFPTEVEEETTITVRIVKGNTTNPGINFSNGRKTTVKSTTMATTEDYGAVTKNPKTTTEKTRATTLMNSTSLTLSFESYPDFLVKTLAKSNISNGNVKDEDYHEEEVEMTVPSTTEGNDYYEMTEAIKSITEAKKKEEKKMEKVRSKRGFGVSLNADLTPETMKKLSIEYLQGKYLVNPTCRLSGNIQCFPVPTFGTCRGKTFCQASQRKPETAESSKSKGLEVWMIVVIVISALFGFMTIGMITYLVVHSCKKLKVQPTHDVTPLNYITKKPEMTEMA